MLRGYDHFGNPALRQCMHACSVMSVTPWTVVHQAPLSKGFSRQEYQSRLPVPSLEDLPNPGIEPASPVSPALAGGCFTTESPLRYSPPLHLCRGKTAPPTHSGPQRALQGHFPGLSLCSSAKGKRMGGRGAMGTKVHFRKSFIANSILCIDFERKH